MPPPCLPAQLPAGSLRRSCPGQLPTSRPCNPLFKPDLLYNILTEELKAVPEEGKAAQEEEQDVQEEEQAGQGTGLFQMDREPHGEW